MTKSTAPPLPADALEAAIASWQQPLQGAGLPAHTLQGLVQSDQIVILHFLRQLGCIFCQHAVVQLNQLRQQNPNFPPIYFVHQSTVAAGQAFFDEYYPGARHISDPSQRLYRLFKINRLGPLSLLDPRSVIKGIRILLGSIRQRSSQGTDVMMLSGTFLFYKGRLRWQHRATWAGDEPNWNRLLAGNKE